MSYAIAHDRTLTEVSRRSDSEFFGLFLFCLVLVSIPIKNLAYVVPPLYLFAQLVCFDSAAAVRTLAVVAFVILISSLSLLIDSLRGQSVNAPGMLLGGLTLLPLFMMITTRFDRRIDEVLFRRISRTVAWFAILQAVVGALQLAASGNPDAVCGTLGFFDFLGSITITQVYFGFLMLSTVLFLLLDTSTLLAKAGILAGVIVSALSQSGHQSVFFAAALVCFTVLQSRQWKLMAGAGCVLVGLLALILYLYPDTLENSKQWYDKTINDPRSPKRLAVNGAQSILSHPKNLVLGTGLGQYSSRAALITSGDMLRVRLPDAVTGQSDYYRTYLDPSFEVFEERGEGSAISKPYFTWLSVVVELGIFQSAVILLLVGAMVAKCISYMYSSSAIAARTGMVGAIGLVFFFLCCSVENYAEFPQGVFIPYLLFVVGLSRASHAVSTKSLTGTESAPT